MVGGARDKGSCNGKGRWSSYLNDVMGPSQKLMIPTQRIWDASCRWLMGEATIEAKG